MSMQCLLRLTLVSSLGRTSCPSLLLCCARAEYQRLNEMLRSRLVQEEDRPQDQGSGRASGKLGSGFEQGGLAGSGTPGVHRTPQAGQGVFGVSPSPWGPVSERGSRRDSLAMTTSDQFFTPPDVS